ncbi:putative ABC transport system substrate-binding protein [Faecalicoccus acidiformans]|uniref:Putative ABC transport system substrate-binding protein n=1 Tax=Faecalicoccus acidiformans TaxID=915173 RepID=A0A7W8G004_9FIRM|nr:ABC transporter substrate-binding protein [Faecalicoccus acidiformans]MBB5185542.1 putative ABC transport system substrate-binding protein [Faecalicoccus acidiformans]
MKALSKLMAAIMASSLLFGCSSSGSTEIPTIGVAQLVSHTSLNTIRDAFTDQMEELGYEDGENINYDFADASGQTSNLNSIMSQYQDEDAAVVVAIATPTAQAAANISEDIPVVFSAVSDPVGAGLVDSLEEPGGNITGTSDEVQVDQILDLALQLVPDAKTVGFLYNASEANSVSNLASAKEYCDQNGLTLIEGTGSNLTELQSSASVLCEQVDVLFAPNDNTVASGMAALSQIALDAQTPFFVGADSMVNDGGLGTVGIDYEELGIETANMVDEILNGEKPSAMSVKVFKDDLNIYINQSALDSLGLTLPEDIQNNERLVIVE